MKNVSIYLIILGSGMYTEDNQPVHSCYSKLKYQKLHKLKISVKANLFQKL